jgi:hypothetical protein
MDAPCEGKECRYDGMEGNYAHAHYVITEDLLFTHTHILYSYFVPLECR